jgi:hypothetical protein
MEPMDAQYNVSLGSQMMMGMEDMDEPIKTPPQIVDDEIRDMILKRKEASRTHYQDKRKVQDVCWNHYKQVYDTTNKEAWQSTIFIPASPKVAEVITSNMHAAQLGPDRPAEYQARQTIFEEKIRDVNDLLAVDAERSQFKVHWTDITRSKVIIGTGIGKIEYKKEYADVQVKERVKENPMMAALRKMSGMPPAPSENVSVKRMVVKDHASTTYVDRYDCFPEPGTVEISKDKWFIERGKICNYKLIELSREQENPVINITDELLMNNPKQLKDPDGDKAEKNAALGELNDETAYMDPDQEHELLEYWGPAPKWMVQPELYGDEQSKYEMVHAWFWLIDGQYVVRRQNTPWRDAEPPYVKDVYIRVPGQFDGVGALELMIGLQIEVNEGVNCRQDEINLKLNSPTAVLKDAVAEGDWNNLVNGPGALWGFSNVDDIRKAFQKIELDGNLTDSWRSTQMIMQEIQEVTAAVKATVGAGGADDEAGGGTFRGQLLNKQVASERFIMYARTSEIMGLAQAYRKMYQRIYQFKSYEEVSAILGDERAKRFEFVAPEQLEKMAKLVPMGVTNMENKGVKLAQMAEQFKMFSGQPWFKPVEHARRMMVVGGDDPDMSIMSDEELAQYNEMKRQLIGQAQMGPGGPQDGPPNGPPSSPVAGNVPGPTDGQPRPAGPPQGPGAASIDGAGMPL